MRINRADEKILEYPKPSLCQIEDLPFEENQTLILCAGFEERATHIARLLKDSSVKNINIVLIKYLPDIVENKSEDIRALANERGYKLVELEYDRYKPEGFSSTVVEKIKNRSTSIFIDISGMTRLLIVQILSEFSQRIDLLEKTRILYCEAEQYPPTKEEAETKLEGIERSPYIDFSFLSAGIYNIAALPELATINVSDSPEYLIAFPSFNPSQLAAAIENSPPSKVTLVNGVPPDKSMGWRTDVIREMNRMPEGPDTDDVRTSTLQYQETLSYLVKTYGENAPFYSMVVSPTGSKMQALAVGLFKGFFKDIQIIFPTHREFKDPTTYTKGVKNLYSLDLSPLANLRRHLRREYQGF